MFRRSAEWRVTGRTTRRFGDRSVQGGFHQLDGTGLRCFVIGREKMVIFEGETVSALEVDRAMTKGELVKRVNFVPVSGVMAQSPFDGRTVDRSA